MRSVAILCLVAALPSLGSARSAEPVLIDPPIWKADRLYAYYGENEVDADRTLKGIEILVTGKIEKIGKDILDVPYVTLCGEKRTSIFGVQCVFTKADESQLAKLSRGDTIVISGTDDGKLGNVILRACRIVGAAELDEIQKKANEEFRQRRAKIEERYRLATARERAAAAEKAKEERAKRLAELERVEKAKWRTWTSADGQHTIEAKFLKAIGPNIYLQKRDGSRIAVDVEKVSDVDRQWIANKARR